MRGSWAIFGSHDNWTSETRSSTVVRRSLASGVHCYQREIYFEGITVSMWKMRKIVDRNWVTLRMSGHLEAKHLVEIQNALADEKMDANVVLDLSEVTLIAREAVKFLARFEVDRIDLQKCPAYIRNWIAQERKNGKNSRSQESEECAK
jgi:hypothetical protein